jgi:hypothetical protein
MRLHEDYCLEKGIGVDSETKYSVKAKDVDGELIMAIYGADDYTFERLVIFNDMSSDLPASAIFCYAMTKLIVK